MKPPPLIYAETLSVLISVYQRTYQCYISGVCEANDKQKAEVYPPNSCEASFGGRWIEHRSPDSGNQPTKILKDLASYFLDLTNTAVF